jgi:hypothetical protein
MNTINTAKTNKVKVYLKPCNSELQKVEDLLTAIDLLIVHNCFMDNNPMRIGGNDILFWDWTIVTVGNFKIPAPIHTCGENQSELFTESGRSVFLSNEECAYTTAYFYLSFLVNISHDWEQLCGQMHPLLLCSLAGGIREIQKVNAEDILFKIRAKLTDKCFLVLN